MNNDDHIAFFITWTIYGTFLQGDQRGWRKRRHGHQTPQLSLANWQRERLNHAVELLSVEHRIVVEAEVERLSQYRTWKL